MNYRQSFLNHVAQTSPFPLMVEMERAEGVYLYDTNNKKYFDLISGIAVSNVGHGNQKVINAIKKQVDKYMHVMVYGEFVQGPQVEFAQLLTSLLPPTLQSVYFVNSGAEAIEGAMKLAKRYTGRPNIIAFNNAYHGSTQGALSVIGNESFKNSFRPLLPGIITLNYNSINDLKRIDHTVAAVIIETFQGEAGVRIADELYMQQLRKLCTEKGVQLIIDEIQCGFGRTGKLFAFEHYNIVPDILCVSKSMGAGLPLGAFIAPHHLMNTLQHNPMLGHLTTFGGNPVCCAAGNAALQFIIEQNLLENIPAKEALFKKLLIHPFIKEVRGKGLLLAIQFDSFANNKKIIDQCIINGVLTDWFLFCDDAMRLAPPLIITESEIIAACNIIIRSINDVLTIAK
jgi:acetylornithine/succinyldiaminopimelate/putrescine aminotransferase